MVSIMEVVIRFVMLTLELLDVFAKLDISALLSCLQNALVIILMHRFIHLLHAYNRSQPHHLFYLLCVVKNLNY